jgi:quinol monooxygenase YgiN
MHARVVHVQIRHDKLDEATKLFQESVIPAMKQQQGNQGGYLLTDRTSGKGLSVSLWESEAAMTASESSGYLQEQLARFRDLFAQQPTPEHYEVSAQT